MADATQIDGADGLAKAGPERTCIVTRQTFARDRLLRFVAGPDGTIVPDLKGTLPGRGVWVTPKRSVVADAVKRSAFARGLKRQVTVPDDLADMTDRLLTQSALGSLGFARKAGQCITGAGKVESAARSFTALALLHASDGAEDGLRKLRQWAYSGSGSVDESRAVGEAGDMTRSVNGSVGRGVNEGMAILRPFTAAELSLALGASHVIHAAIMQGGAGRNALTQISRLVTYRDG